MMTVAERFWSKVDRSAGPDGCWIWRGMRNPKGYGKFQLGTCKLAHRVAYELSVGPIPEGMLVCHTCDNPPCENPAHLFLGTNADNMRDAREKQRFHSPAANWTHCIRGHEFTPQNTRITKHGFRSCMECERWRHSVTYLRQFGGGPRGVKHKEMRAAS